MKRKVMHILWSGGTGGAEAFARDIAFYSDRDRFEHVICFLSEGGWVADVIAKRGHEVIVLGMKHGWSLTGAWRLAAALRKARPDLIHNHALNYLANFVLRAFSRVPRLYFEHGGELLAPDPRKELLFYSLFGKHHDRVLTNSEYMRQRILLQTTVAPWKVEVSYIGIDIPVYAVAPPPGSRRALGIPETDKVVGIVGRLVEMKGIDDFIRIAALVRKAVPSGASFIVVGEGELRQPLEVLAWEMGVDIRFLGDRADVPSLLPLFDVFVFTSKWEPFGMVILEAMAAGVPVVGFKTDGAVEIMSRGGAAMIEGRDHQKAADAVLDILSHPPQARALAAAGRSNVAENFEVRGSVARLERVYEELLERD